jgi:hypothetical protein
MAGGDAAKLENEKQKNLADQQDQSPHKDAPRWNEALAVSPLANPGRHRQRSENEMRAGGLLGGGTVNDRGSGMMKGRFGMLIRPNFVFLLLFPSTSRSSTLNYTRTLPCFPSHLSIPSTSLPSQTSILIYPTTTAITTPIQNAPNSDIPPSHRSPNPRLSSRPIPLRRRSTPRTCRARRSSTSRRSTDTRH